MSTLAVPEMEKHESRPLTAEGLLRRRARQRPAALALVDPDNRQALGYDPPRSFTYAEADAAVDALASQFIELGLEPGDRIAMQLPNFAEAPLAFLAAWRAGLTVVALPMLWRAMEIGKACEAVQPKALLGVAEFAEESPAEALCEIAATHMSVRFVLGFGRHLPDGVASLDEAIEATRGASAQVEPRKNKGPVMITFTARAGFPLLPLLREEDEILAQGAMTVLALSLDSRDVILNPYPLTGPVGLSLGLAPWLISGATLAQHHPFDYEVLLDQALATGATVTALPAPVLTELTEDGVFRNPQCRLRRLGCVWSISELAAAKPAPGKPVVPFFDLYPLGDLASLVLRCEPRPTLLPLGSVHVAGDGNAAVFAETKLRDGQSGDREVLMRGPVVPRGEKTGPLAADPDGFVGTGLFASAEAGGRMCLKQDLELIHHGGFTIAASELDTLYQSFPGFLDAVCFALPDPVVGDRIFGAVVPSPSVPVSLEALHRFLMERGVAPYKVPDKLLVVRQIPRDGMGRIQRDQILMQV